MLARRTTSIIFKPLFKAVIVKYLLTIAALHIFLLTDVETDWTEEGIHEFLIGRLSILFGHLVIACKFKNEIICHFLNFCNKIFCFLLHVIFKPCTDSKGTLIVHWHNILLVVVVCGDANHIVEIKIL